MFGGSIKLFRAFGIPVYLHWSWFLLVLYEVQYRSGSERSTYGGYHVMLWNLAEVLAVFGIVLVHEFGHALACKSVGGQADSIVLWPLGGLALARAPFRPGAQLWTVAAGPLVNVVLLPLTIGAWALAARAGEAVPDDVYLFVQSLAGINIFILAFNLLPVYPLDGGQILWSLLWFLIGPFQSLRIATGIGFLAAISGAIWALITRPPNVWLLVAMASFLGLSSWRGFQAAQRAIAQQRSAAQQPGPPPV